MTVSTLMAASGCSRFARHVLNGLFALATPLGAILFYAGVSHRFGSNPAFLGGALAFCAGTFLCIAEQSAAPFVFQFRNTRTRPRPGDGAGLDASLAGVRHE